MPSKYTDSDFWLTCNSTLSDLHIKEEPIWKSLTFHHFGLILSAIFALIAFLVSTWLIHMHATHYSKPYIQRHIIRILFMVPIYAVVSFLSYKFYRHAIYFEVLRDCYEAFAIASFFTLLCHYVADNLHDQKDYFRKITPKAWVWPVTWMKKCCGNLWRTPRSGLTWFNIIWFNVFQYCFIRITMTVVAVVTQAFGRYCEASLSPAFAHLWVMVIEASSVTMAMYCLIQFYIQLKDDLAAHRPFLKILCIKLVIFFSFWQTLVIGLLISTKALKPTDRINYPDLKVGIPALLLCIEMAIFAVLHVFAFSWKPFLLTKHPMRGMQWESPKEQYQGGPLGIKAYADAYNPWDLIKAVGRSFRWVFVGRRTRHLDPSYGPRPGDEVNLSTNEPGKAAKGKQGQYQQLSDGEDSRPMLGYSAPIATEPSKYEPMRAPDHKNDSSIDITSVAVGPDKFTTKHPTPGTVKRSQEKKSSVIDEIGSDSDFQVVHKPSGHGIDSDTSYRGSALAPAGRK